MLPRIQEMGLQALCVRVVRQSVRASGRVEALGLPRTSSFVLEVTVWIPSFID